LLTLFLTQTFYCLKRFLVVGNTHTYIYIYIWTYDCAMKLCERRNVIAQECLSYARSKNCEKSSSVCSSVCLFARNVPVQSRRIFVETLFKNFFFGNLSRSFQVSIKSYKYNWHFTRRSNVNLWHHQAEFFKIRSILEKYQENQNAFYVE
jgi:hypothetical protein